MKNLTVTLMVLLLVAFSVATCGASIIYQDNFQTNDYASRYLNQDGGKDGWWPNDWTYVNFTGGNIGFAPSACYWASAIETTNYANGNFTNPSYSVSVSMISPTTTLQPYFGFSLLDNGIVAGGAGFSGYSAMMQNDGGNVGLSLSRVNSDGSSTSLFDYHDPWSLFYAADLTKWSTLTATVQVLPAETDLTFAWAGVDTAGNPSSYSCSAVDSSAQRWTSGTGLGLFGWGGANAPVLTGGVSAIDIDNLVVSTVPEPGSLVALACGLVSLLGLRRRRI